MIYFSAQLAKNPTYKPAAERLFSALRKAKTDFRLLDGTRDIWLRDFMPVKTRTGTYVSFRYTPSYLADTPELRTDYRSDIAPAFSLSVTDSFTNLDGGNVVFSPSKEKAVVSDRVFSENPAFDKTALLKELEKVLQAQVLVIPSLASDMTGHADGMVRFIDETTAIGNRVPAKNGLEQKIKAALRPYGIQVVDFPYFASRNNSAVGCYLNFLETENYIFLPTFGVPMDQEAIETAGQLFQKAIVPVRVPEIAQDGGALNCISWES